MVEERIFPTKNLKASNVDKQTVWFSGGGGGGTVLQLLTIVDKWTEILDRDGIIDAICCDFFMHFCPGTMTTQAESISSDLQRGLGRRLRYTTLNTEQNEL